MQSITMVTITRVAAVLFVLAIVLQPVHSIAGALSSGGKGATTTTTSMTTGELDKIKDRLLQMCRSNKSAYCVKRLQLSRMRRVQEQKKFAFKRASMLIARNNLAIRNLQRFVRSEFS